MAFDYNGTGKQDHLVCYRPGTGTIWISCETRLEPSVRSIADFSGAGRRTAERHRRNLDRPAQRNAVDWRKEGISNP